MRNFSARPQGQTGEPASDETVSVLLQFLRTDIANRVQKQIRQGKAASEFGERVLNSRLEQYIYVQKRFGRRSDKLKTL